MDGSKNNRWFPECANSTFGKRWVSLSHASCGIRRPFSGSMPQQLQSRRRWSRWRKRSTLPPFHLRTENSLAIWLTGDCRGRMIGAVNFWSARSLPCANARNQPRTGVDQRSAHRTDVLWEHSIHWCSQCFSQGPSIEARGIRPREFVDAIRPISHPPIGHRGHPLRSCVRGRFGFHNFRHSLASFLVRSKTDVKTVQALLRRSDVKTTLQRYRTAWAKIGSDGAQGAMLNAILSNGADKCGLTADWAVFEKVG